MGRAKKTEDSGLPGLESELAAVSARIKSFGVKCRGGGHPELAELVSCLRRKTALLEQLLAMERRENERLAEANARLADNRKRLRFELRRAMGFKERRKAADVPVSEACHASAGRRGAPKGHRGASRPVPDSWDAEFVFAEPGECACGCMLVEGTDEYDLKYVEDIVPARRTVTLLKYRRGRCSGCGRTLRHPDASAGPPVATGKNLAAHLAVLRNSGITYRQLASISGETLGLPLSPSGALGIVARTADRLNPSYEHLLSLLPEQEVLHADETGWKVRADLHYVWVMCNRQLACYHVDKSRSSAVPENLLGADYKGTAHCDFYAAYNFLGKTQRCLVHLMRDVKKEREMLPGSEALRQFEERLWAFIEQGRAVQKIEDGTERAKQAEPLKKEIVRIGKMRMPSVGKGEALAKRILKYRDDIVRFVEDPALEWHNNRAERQIRPLVVSRKMSFGSDAREGARKTCVLHSVAATCRLQGVNPLEFIGKVLADERPDIFGKTGKSGRESPHDTS